MDLKYPHMLKRPIPHIPVIWGGRHCTAVPDVTLNDSRIDILVRGEGELAFLELVKALSEKRDIEEIKGVSYKTNGSIVDNGEALPLDLSTSPRQIPWHLIDIKRKLSGKAKKSIGIQTGRGCPFACTYCSHEKVSIEKYRFFDTDYVMDNIEPLIRRT